MPDRPYPAAPDFPKPSLPPRPAVELRRRGELRVEKFLLAATEVFNEKGFRDARLSDIVKRAGGSLATLYRVFGDKEGLVHALMEDGIRDFGHRLDELLLSPHPPAIALENSACSMVEYILDPTRIVCHRIVTAEGLSQPALRDWFHAHCVAPMETQLAEYFTREAKAGRLLIEDPTSAADHFYMLVFGGLILRSVNGRISTSDLPQAQMMARSAVRLFLKGTLPQN